MVRGKEMEGIKIMLFKIEILLFKMFMKPLHITVKKPCTLIQFRLTNFD